MGSVPFYRDFDVSLLVWDLSPSWVVLVVNDENGVCGTRCMKFLPRIKQRVVLCLCRTFREFLVEFTKYNFIVHGYDRLDKLIHKELPSSYFSVINRRVFVYVLVLGWLDIGMVKIWTMTQGRVILVLIPIIYHIHTTNETISKRLYKYSTIYQRFTLIHSSSTITKI